MVLLALVIWLVILKLVKPARSVVFGLPLLLLPFVGLLLLTGYNLRAESITLLFYGVFLVSAAWGFYHEKI